MRKAVYDTRFFAEYFYTTDKELLRRMKNYLGTTKKRYISSVSIHEIYRLVLSTEGRKTAKERIKILAQDFRVVDVDTKLAVLSAELRQKYRVPMADSMIAATALALRAPVVTDDEHFDRMREIRTKWF